LPPILSASKSFIIIALFGLCAKGERSLSTAPSLYFVLRFLLGNLAFVLILSSSFEFLIPAVLQALSIFFPLL
jgi:hypothetical protein